MLYVNYGMTVNQSLTLCQLMIDVQPRLEADVIKLGAMGSHSGL
jgi:hypothetical protein